MIVAPRRDRVVVAGLAGLAVAATLIATRKGAGISPDSTAYLSAGTSLATGHGLRGFDGSLLTIFPPGMPFIVAVGNWLGASAAFTVRLFNAFAFGAIVIVTHIILKRHVKSTVLVYAATGLAAVGVPILTVAERVYTEPGFILVSLLLILVLETMFDRPVLWMAVGVLLVWTGFLLRYAGVALIPVGAISILVTWRTCSRRRAFKRASLFAVAASTVPIIWMFRNHGVDGTYLGARGDSLDTVGHTLKRFVYVVGSFILPDPIPTALQAVAGIGLIAVTTTVLTWAVSREATSDARASTGTSDIPLLTFTTIYTIYIVVAQLSTAIDELDGRLLSPLFIPTVVILAMFLEGLVRHVNATRRKKAGAAAAFLLAALVLGNGVAFARATHAGALHGIDYGSDQWTTSPTMAAIARVSTNEPLYSNNPWAVWALLNRDSVLDSPTKGGWRSTSNQPIAQQFLDDACKGALLAWFAYGGNHYTPEDLQDVVNLIPLSENDDGTLFRIEPRTGISTCTTG